MMDMRIAAVGCIPLFCFTTTFPFLVVCLVPISRLAACLGLYYMRDTQSQAVRDINIFHLHSAQQ